MRILLALLILSWGVATAAGLRTEADSLFRAGDYERVELLVLRSELQDSLSPEDRVALQLLGAYSLIMLDRERDARPHYVRALEVDSTLTLDPVQVSPKFRTVFDDVKQEWLNKRTQVVPAAAIREFQYTQGARASSQLANLALPGAGFLAEGKTARGVTYLAAQLAATALWLAELNQNNSAREEYLAAASSAQADERYDDYDTHHRRMWAFGLTSAGVYLVSQVDLALFRHSSTAFELLPTESGARLQVRF